MYKEFLEEYSLFRKFECNIPETVGRLPKPSINMTCRDCVGIQTFNMTNSYYNYTTNELSGNKKFNLVYQCQSCKEFFREFNVYTSPDLDYVYKYGQYPEWEISIDKNLKSLLGKHEKNYRKGLVCESQGYGIGAYAYYRRIIEEIIDELLDSISDLIENDNQQEYKIALEQTKNTQVTKDKINLVKDLIPTILKPDGMNPLGVLHSELSKGLHAETDEVCLENAIYIKNILIFLVNQILNSKATTKVFSESMKSLLDKKSKK